MSRMFLLFLAFALAACDSDFDKCMNTELPRASEAIKPEKSRLERILRDPFSIEELKSARAEMLELKARFQPVINWHEENSSGFREPELAKVYESLGFDPVFKMSETSTVYEDEAFRFKHGERIGRILDKNRLALAFGKENGCWGQLTTEYKLENGCYRPFMYWARYKRHPDTADKVSHMWWGPQGLYVGIRFTDEVLNWAAEGSGVSLNKMANQTATLACNANGIYE